VSLAKWYTKYLDVATIMWYIYRISTFSTDQVVHSMIFYIFIILTCLQFSSIFRLKRMFLRTWALSIRWICPFIRLIRQWHSNVPYAFLDRGDWDSSEVIICKCAYAIHVAAFFLQLFFSRRESLGSIRNDDANFILTPLYHMMLVTEGCTFVDRVCRSR